MDEKTILEDYFVSKRQGTITHIENLYSFFMSHQEKYKSEAKHLTVYSTKRMDNILSYANELILSAKDSALVYYDREIKKLRDYLGQKPAAMLLRTITPYTSQRASIIHQSTIALLTHTIELVKTVMASEMRKW